MDRLGTMKRAVFLAALILCFPASRGQAQSIGGACSTAGSLSLIGSSSPGELLVCNGSTWSLAEAITSGGLVGIGTTSPAQTLEVNGIAQIDGSRIVTGVDGANFFWFKNSAG